MKYERREIDEQLHAALRRGDPAAGDALTPQEVRALRRAARAAAEPAARRRWLPLPAPSLAAAAVAVCCLVAGLALWRVVSPAPAGSGGKDQVGREGAGSAGEEGPAAALGATAGGVDPLPERAAEAGNLVRERTAALDPRARRDEGERHSRPRSSGALTGSTAAPNTVQVQEAQLAPAPADPPPTFLPTQLFSPEVAANEAPIAPLPTADELVRAEIAAITEEMAWVAPPAPAAIEAPAAEPLVASAPEPAAEAPGLKLQFSTPGGTRIIWVLASESES